MITTNIKILNLEASKVYGGNFIINNNNIQRYLVGTIPYSLFSIKLQNENLKIKYDKKLNCYMNFDIININFNSAIKELDKNETVNLVKEKNVKIVQGKYGKTIMNTKELRKALYDDGFTLNVYGKEIKYVKLTHTSSKARIGACTFINEKYYDVMLNYLRMGIKFIGDVDWCSLNSYESLVMSSIIKTINIPTNQICLVDDDYFNTTIYGDVVELNNNDEVVVNTRNIEQENCIFDGEGLLDESYAGDHSVNLLRNQFGKCCTLSTNIKQFKKDNNIDYFEDMFGNKYDCPILILTPSSIKLFKFKKYFNDSLEDTWNYYKETISSTWGIVKQDKKSKFGDYYNQITYQVLNSILVKDDIEASLLLMDELEYIKALKFDLEVFKQHISDNCKDITKNFILSMLNMNSDFQYTEMFRTFRHNCIKLYVNNLKGGKCKIKNLDYHIIFGLPNQLLRKAARMEYEELPNSYDCYTNKYDENTKLFTYRNPHISAGNICILNNTYYSNDIKYFNLSKNVLLVNSANSDVCQRWNGADFDSDCVGVTDNKLLIEIYNHTPKFELPINNIPMVKLKEQDTSILDDKISNNLIGEVCNLASLLQSIYFDGGCKDDRIPKYVSLLAVASNCEIDGAKRRYKVDGKSLLKKVREDLEDIFERDTIKIKKQKLSDDEMVEYENGNKKIIYGEKDALVRPMFLKYAQDGYENYSYKSMNCTLDIMINVITKFNYSNRVRKTQTLNISNFINKTNVCRKSDRHQIQSIIDLVVNYNNDYLAVKFDNSIDKLTKLELQRELQKETIDKLSKKKIKQETIYTILYRMFVKKENILYHNRMVILEFLLYSHPNEFKECFKSFDADNTLILVEDDAGDINIWGYTYKKVSA